MALVLSYPSSDKGGNSVFYILAILLWIRGVARFLHFSYPPSDKGGNSVFYILAILLRIRGVTRFFTF
jgi:hypothetical protein